MDLASGNLIWKASVRNSAPWISRLYSLPLSTTVSFLLVDGFTDDAGAGVWSVTSLVLGTPISFMQAAAAPVPVPSVTAVTAVTFVKPPTTPTGSPAGSADCEINQRGCAHVVSAGGLAQVRIPAM